jgi:hypothetical protein
MGHDKCWTTSIAFLPSNTLARKLHAGSARCTYAPALHFLICLYALSCMHLHVCNTVRRRHNTVQRRRVSEYPHKSLSGLHFTRLQASPFPGACTVARDSHVRSKFEKESDSGTSVASDPVRGDPW